MYSKTLANSAFKPSAVRRAVGCGGFKQFEERSALQRQDAEFRQNLLLPDPQAKRVGSQVRGRILMRCFFDNDFRRFRLERYDFNHFPAFAARATRGGRTL